jgi:hypothetical protein
MRRALIVLWGLIVVCCASAQSANFTFEYVLHGGYGETPVRIRVNGNRATIVRQLARNEGEAIGVFECDLNAPQRSRLQAAIPDSVASTIAPERDGSYHAVRLQTPQRNVNLRVADHPDALAGIAKLLAEVAEFETKLPWRAVRSLTLELVPPGSAVAARRPVEFTVRLRNAGTKAVRLPLRESSLFVAAMPSASPAIKPGVTPLPRVWENVTAATVALPKTVDLAPGAFTDLKIPATFDQAGQLLVHAQLELPGGIDPEKPEVFGSTASKPVSIAVR